MFEKGLPASAAFDRRLNSLENRIQELEKEIVVLKKKRSKKDE